MPLMQNDNGRRTTWRRTGLALAGVIAVLAGLLAPVAPAQAATYGKPKVSVSAVSGAGALKVSWKVLRSSTGVAATTFRVYYGTSSTFSKASYKTVDLTLGKANNNSGSATSPYYILTGLDTKKTYNVWVRPWDTTSNKANGTLSSRASKKTTGYGYSAPGALTAVNAGKDTVELTWRTVTGAPSYRLRAVGGGRTLYSHTGAEGNWVFTGLTPSVKYTFSVSVEQPPVSGIPAYVKMSGESSGTAKATTMSKGYLDSPTGLTTRDDPTYEFDKYGQRHNSIDLSWEAPVGFDPARHGIQVDFATNQEMKAEKGYFAMFADDGDGIPERSAANPRVGEFIVDTVTPVTAGRTSTQPPAPLDELDELPPSEPAEPSESPTSPAPETPSVSPTIETPPATEPTETESPVPTPTGTVPNPATESPSAPAADSTAEAKQLAMPAADAPVRYWGRVFNLPTNKNWYLRVKVITKEAGGLLVARSERTEGLMGKTLSAKGYITGRVVLPSGVPATSYVVAAYSGAEVHDQAPVKADGSYQLYVRPGKYFVQASYIGGGNFNTRWASSVATAGRTRTDSTGTTQVLNVAVGKAVSAVPINPQSTASFGLSGDIDCPGSDKGCEVDVAAMSAWGKATVLRQDRTDTHGGYSLQGLPAGKYVLRVSHIEDRYKALQLSVEIKSDGTVTGKRDGALVPRPWITKYAAKISGTKKVGKTLKLSSKAWIASELPVVRAVPKCQWQRNGVNISGATKCSYKLRSSDRGKSIRVRVVNFRFGFQDNRSYSKSYRVG